MLAPPVTGAAAQEDSARANRRPDSAGARTVIDGRKATDHAVVPNLTELLGGRIPGGMVYRPNGLLGVGGVVRVRGLRSLALSNDPLIELDGFLLPPESPAFSI